MSDTSANNPTAATVLVRDAREADYDAIAELTVAAYRDDGLTPEEYFPTLADVVDRAKHADLLVTELDGAVLAAVALVLDGGPYAELAMPPDEAEFRMLAVHPSAHSRGLGRLLVEECLRRAKARGLRRMVISTEARNGAAHRLYARTGFIREPARDWSPLPGVDLLCFSRPL